MPDVDASIETLPLSYGLLLKSLLRERPWRHCSAQKRVKLLPEPARRYLAYQIVGR